MSLLIQPWVCGIFGAIAAEVLYVYRMRRERPPRYLQSVFYWVSTSFMVLVSGGLVYVYQSVGLVDNPLIALHLGISTPVIIGNLLVKSPNVNNVGGA